MAKIYNPITVRELIKMLTDFGKPDEIIRISDAEGNDPKYANAFDVYEEDGKKYFHLYGE